MVDPPKPINGALLRKFRAGVMRRMAWRAMAVILRCTNTMQHQPCGELASCCTVDEPTLPWHSPCRHDRPVSLWACTFARRPCSTPLCEQADALCCQVIECSDLRSPAGQRSPRGPQQIVKLPCTNLVSTPRQLPWLTHASDVALASFRSQQIAAPKLRSNWSGRHDFGICIAWVLMCF